MARPISRLFVQIVDSASGSGNQKETTLVEVGPRFALNLIKVFSGSFGGATLYDNPQYRSPNEVCPSVFLP